MIVSSVDKSMSVVDEHRVDSPKNESETTNSAEKGASLGVLGQSSGTTVYSELVDDD